MTCQIDAADDATSPEFFTACLRTARKNHKCYECQEIIRPNEKYEVTSGKWEGEISTVKTCALCMEIRDRLFCSFIYGEIWEAMREENVFTISLKDLSVPAIEKIERFWRAGVAD